MQAWLNFLSYFVMNYIEISSRNNDKIKYVNKLVASSKERNTASLFVCEGVRLCCDAAISGYEIKEAYITKEAFTKYSEKANIITESSQKVYLISEEVKEKLSDTVNSQGVFCVVKMKSENSHSVESGNRYVALDSVQNPQNLGAVARTAEALGIDGVIVSGGCDIYNPKALRASMGSLLRIPVIKTDNLCLLIKELSSNGLLTFSTVPDRSAADITSLDFSKGAVAVIGNEGNGVSQEVQDAASVRATIKMSGNAESLNASTAAVITMWEMMK